MELTRYRYKYTYLFSEQDKKEAIYFSEKTQKFYKLKTETFDKKYGFIVLFLAPLNFILNNNLDGDILINYFLSCVLGLIMGIAFILLLHRSFRAKKMEQVKLESQDIEKGINNLKQVWEIKLTLLVAWIIFFCIVSVMFFDKKNYTSLLCVSIMCSFLLPLLTNLNFIRHKRVRSYLKQLLK